MGWFARSNDNPWDTLLGDGNPWDLLLVDGDPWKPLLGDGAGPDSIASVGTWGGGRERVEELRRNLRAVSSYIFLFGWVSNSSSDIQLLRKRSSYTYHYRCIGSIRAASWSLANRSTQWLLNTMATQINTRMRVNNIMNCMRSTGKKQQLTFIYRQLLFPLFFE